MCFGNAVLEVQSGVAFSFHITCLMQNLYISNCSLKANSGDSLFSLGPVLKIFSPVVSDPLWPVGLDILT